MLNRFIRDAQDDLALCSWQYACNLCLQNTVQSYCELYCTYYSTVHIVQCTMCEMHTGSQELATQTGKLSGRRCCSVRNVAQEGRPPTKGANDAEEEV